jgi:hypothetical protein
MPPSASLFAFQLRPGKSASSSSTWPRNQSQRTLFASISGYFGRNRVHCQERREYVRTTSSVLGGCSCLMMMPICTGSISVDSPILLAPYSPISATHLLFAVWQEEGVIFMAGIPVVKCAGLSNSRAIRSWGRSTSWSMILECWNTGTSRRDHLISGAGLSSGLFFRGKRHFSHARIPTTERLPQLII